MVTATMNMVDMTDNNTIYNMYKYNILGNNFSNLDKSNDNLKSIVAVDLYSHQYGLETIKTISNTGYVSNNIITTVITVVIILCIRDCLREYKSYYVIFNSMKMSFYNSIIISENSIFNLLFWLLFNILICPFNNIMKHIK